MRHQSRDFRASEAGDGHGDGPMMSSGFRFRVLGL